MVNIKSRRLFAFFFLYCPDLYPPKEESVVIKTVMPFEISLSLTNLKVRESRQYFLRCNFTSLGIDQTCAFGYLCKRALALV